MIRVSHLNKTYGKAERSHSRRQGRSREQEMLDRKRSGGQVLHDVSFTLPDTGFVCIVGASGCGKTTLLNAMGGLDTFDSGTVSTDTLDQCRCGSRRTEQERNQNFGYIFQNYYLLPEHSAAYNVYLGLHSLALSHKEKLHRVREALEAVDMARYARRKVGELSGGQQQRVAIARALAKRPKVIFADEPTGNLDQANTVNICTLLRRISRTSLVVMVTHEEEIARFFADRILSIADGRIVSDTDTWERTGLQAGGKALYAGEYDETRVGSEEVSLRILREENAEPVQITLAVLKDRIVIKLDDSRRILCGKTEDMPVLAEGKRPVLQLETLDQDPSELIEEEPSPMGRPGSGIGFAMQWKEAKQMVSGRKLRRLGESFFLIVLTVLALLTLGDFGFVSSIDPEDFITTDSHILEVQLARGADLGAEVVGLQSVIKEYVDYLDGSGMEFDFLPPVSVSAECGLEMFNQLGSVSEKIYFFSYVPLEHLDQGTLLYGRMPETAEEIVVDRWVLDAVLAEDGIVQSKISDVTYFLGKQFFYSKKNYTPTIVGICDSGEPAIYMKLDAIGSLGAIGTEMVSLSDLKTRFPGKYDDMTLAPDECILVVNNAGIAYTEYTGSTYTTNSKQRYTTAAVIEEPDTYATMVVADEAVKQQVKSMMSARFYLYCQDKEAMKAFLAKTLPEELEGRLQITVTDQYAVKWEQHITQTRERISGRIIVTATVAALSMVMLYLLQRSRVQERIGMIAVYRLLGIPGRKLMEIFAMECCQLSVRTILPAGLLTWAAVGILNELPSQEIQMILTWPAALLGAGAILLFYLLVSALSLYRLLRQPPAHLAGKFDF